MNKVIQKPEIMCKARTLVVGDIHGRYSAFVDVLNKSYFDKYKDKLIVIGDVVDRGKKSKQVVEELVKIPYKIVLLGNHDKWFFEYMKYGKPPEGWLEQGGYKTLESYLPDSEPGKIPPTHRAYFESAKLYYEQDNMVFVHASFNPKKHPREEKEENLIWGRNIVYHAMEGNKIGYWKLVFVGHTPVQMVQEDADKPLVLQNLVMMDCGAGHGKNLAIMNIHTREYWVSSAKD